jgi:hypothetical protein
MSRSGMLREGDVGAIMATGRCRTRVGDHAARWRTHLISGLARLVAADFGSA